MYRRGLRHGHGYKQQWELCTIGSLMLIYNVQSLRWPYKLTKHNLMAATVVEVEKAVGWPRLWDLALDHGPKCVNGLRNLVRVLTFPPHALSACPLCKNENIPRDALLSHVLDTHSRSRISSSELLPSLLSVTDSDSALFQHLCSLANLFWYIFSVHCTPCMPPGPIIMNFDLDFDFDKMAS